MRLESTETDVIHWVYKLSRNVCDPRNDGFTAWCSKQDLYQLKFILDEAIANCPTFEPERGWLKEQEQKKIIKILKG